MKKLTAIIKSVISISALMSLTSCTDLKSVEELGTMRTKLIEGYMSLNDDIYISCLKRSSYSAKLFPGIIKTREEKDKKCNEVYKPVSEKVNDANSLLFSYLEKLVVLATNKPGFFRPNLDKLQASISGLNMTLGSGGIKPLNSSVITSSFNVLNVLAELFTYGFRASNTKTAIICTDSDIQNLISGLKSIVRDGNLEFIQSEEMQLKNYYEDLRYLPNPNLTLPDVEASHNLTQSYNVSLDKIIEKRTAALEYIKILESTAKAHGELAMLFQGEENNSKKAEKCTAFFDEGKKIREENKKANRSASSSINLSKEEAEKVQLIINRYQRDLARSINLVNKDF